MDGWIMDGWMDHGWMDGWMEGVCCEMGASNSRRKRQLITWARDVPNNVSKRRKGRNPQRFVSAF